MLFLMGETNTNQKLCISKVLVTYQLEGMQQMDNYHRKRILITGGAGYIGSILIYKLKINDAKIKITILDNLQNCDNTKHITSKFPDICVKKGEIEDINIIFLSRIMTIGQLRKFQGASNSRSSN